MNPAPGTGDDRPAEVGERDRPQQQVSALRHGTVVDHLNAGMALKALQALGFPSTNAALLGIQLESRKLGRKDIMKLDGVELTPADVARIAVFGPQATVSWIREYKVVRKMQVTLPDVIAGTLVCPNPNCVSVHERIESRFDVEVHHPIRVRCRYCERRITEDEIVVR